MPYIIYSPYITTDILSKQSKYTGKKSRYLWQPRSLVLEHVKHLL